MTAIFNELEKKWRMIQVTHHTQALTNQQSGTIIKFNQKSFISNYILQTKHIALYVIFLKCPYFLLPPFLPHEQNVDIWNEMSLLPPSLSHKLNVDHAADGKNTVLTRHTRTLSFSTTSSSHSLPPSHFSLSSASSV